MDYLKLNSARRILQTVASNNGSYTWYNIVKTVDQMDDVEKLPPTYEVLKELTRLMHLRVDTPEGDNASKYWITKSGLAFLSRTGGN
ncbi:MAG: hypothetical protein F6K19_47695 [Cyanothece sp. SIO1E1]|nr:hypothetical protein [Cyanothece sp. SIO1E1]